MNWVRRIRFLLGAFWYRIFDDQDFVLGVEFFLSVFYKCMGYRLDNWVAGMFPMLPTVYPDDMPFAVLLDLNSLHREWFTWKQFVNKDVTVAAGQHIGKPTDDDYVTLHSDGRGWVMDVVSNTQEPDYLVDHLYRGELALTNGADFIFSGNQILFFIDPTKLNIPSVKVTTANGELKVYLQLTGIVERVVNSYDAISGFMSPELNDCASVVWDIHQNGATYYNAKKLLAAVTDSVVCDAEGAINELWQEQGWNFARVNDKIYESKLPCNLHAGDDVKKGTVLFGTMKFYKGSEKPSASEIPGVRVRTDAGELVAENSTKDLVNITGTTANVLPLTGDTPTLLKYLNICIQNSLNEKCPYIQVQSDDSDMPAGKINPYDFVMRQLRRGRTCAVRLTAISLTKLEAAIQVLRKSTNLGGLLTLYVKDSTDTANVTLSGFAADAGMGVVAVDATVTIQGQAAEARILP